MSSVRVVSPDPSQRVSTRGWMSRSPRRPSFLRQPLVDSDGRKSLALGPTTHRLPFRVMWCITLATAGSMAIINFVTIGVIEYSVKWKFRLMDTTIRAVGVGPGIAVLTGVSLVYALAGVCLVMFVAPSCGGSGLPENKCYLNGSNLPGFFTRRTLRVRILTSILANAAGFPVGREGPTVVIGSNVAYLISQYFAEDYVREWVDLSWDSGLETSRPALLVDEERIDAATRIACAVGGACGMAMIFNAPFGGVLYMFEEITAVAWPLELTFRVFVSTMFCAFASYGMLNACGKDIQEFVIYAFVQQNKDWHWDDIPWFILTAACLGVITSFHTRGMLACAKWRQSTAKRMKNCQPWAKIGETLFYGALCALASTLVSLSAVCVEEGDSGLQYVPFNCPDGHYNPVASLLVNTSHSSVKLLFSGNNAGEIGFTAAMLAFITYGLLNVGLTGLPVPGGAFTATMLMGGLFGRALGELGMELGVVRTVSGVYAVVGSAAMLCGFKQMTLAVVLIVVECINDLTLAPVVMLSVSVSMVVNWSINKRGHDEEQIHSKELPFLEGDPPPSLDSTMAKSLCDELDQSARLPPEADEESVKKALNMDSKAGFFPVVEPDTCVCLGVIKRSHLEEALEARSLQPKTKRTTSRAFVDDPFEAKDDLNVKRVSTLIQTKSKCLPLYRLMDPTPFMVLEDMPAPRLYNLFSKAGERFACVVSREGRFRGIISRQGLIAAARETPER